MSNDINDVLGVSTAKHSDTTNPSLTKKYPALRTFSGIISIIAWIIALLTFIIVLV